MILNFQIRSSLQNSKIQPSKEIRNNMGNDIRNKQ